MEYDYDFSGWATRNDLKCSDGRTIRHNAFKDCDGLEVPLVWNHSHGEPENVLGHALLKNKDEGVYCYGKFNDTSSGQVAKVLVQHGDIKALSIYANQLKQVASDVIHGVIREVSLVHAGANPGAFIDTILTHSDDGEEEAVIYTGEDIYLSHSDGDKEIKNNTNNKKGDSEMEDNKEKTIQDVIDSMTEEQQNVLYALIAKAMEDSNDEDEDTTEEGAEMKHNVFDNDNTNNTLIHDGLNEILKNAKSYGSLKDSFMAHAADYGIENIEYLNSEDKDIYDRPQWINTQPTGWVETIMKGVHNTPFAKVRMQFADITEDEARAKGYIKGKFKKEEVFKLLKRSVGPTTIYKKQKFDRDDLIDADFDVIPWVKEEMSIKFDEEKARAYIFGDGRSSSDEDKVDEACIIPVIKDSDLYSIKADITIPAGKEIEDVIVDEAMIAMDDYQGSGNTIAFLDQKLVTKIRLLKDEFGHRLYKDDDEVAGAMGFKKIVRVPGNVIPANIYGVALDLSDYNVGMKNAGKKNFFDDFDIDYNQQKYLMEERQSGCLTRPYSAVVLRRAE